MSYVFILMIFPAAKRFAAHFNATKEIQAMNEIAIKSAERTGEAT